MIKAKKREREKARKAKKLNNMLPSPPSLEEKNDLGSPGKTVSQSTEPDIQAQPSITDEVVSRKLEIPEPTPKSTPIEKSNRHQKRKENKTKPVDQEAEKKEEQQKVISKQLYWDWKDEADKNKKQQKVSQKQLSLKNKKKDKRISSNNQKEEQKVIQKQLHLEDSEKKDKRASSNNHGEEQKVVQKQLHLEGSEKKDERALSNNQKEEQKVVQKRFFWSDNKQNSSSPNSATTQTIDAHQTIHRTYWPNGKLKEEFIDNKLSVSQRREVECKPLPQVEYKPLPQVMYVPAIKVTEFALTSLPKVACLRSMQAASKDLMQLILAAESLNTRTLEEYYNHVISFHNHIQSLSEQGPVSPEIDYQYPVNPKTVLDIVKVNWAMHENFTKLFEYKDPEIIAKCIAWRYETFRLLKQILPSGHWIEGESVLVARLCSPEGIQEPDPQPSAIESKLVRPSSVRSILWNSTPTPTKNGPSVDKRYEI